MGVILKKSQKKGSCLEKSVNSLLKKSLNLSKLFEPTLNMKINVHVFVKACLFMVHFTKIVMSLPCTQLTTEQCKEVSRMVQLHCNPKLTKKINRRCGDYNYKETLQCVERLCAEPEAYLVKQRMTTDKQDQRVSRFHTTLIKGMYRPKDVKRYNMDEGTCPYNHCPECHQHINEDPDCCKYCCEKCPGNGNGNDQLNPNVYVMVITLLMLAIIHARLMAIF